jgi:hypothetical protein
MMGGTGGSPSLDGGAGGAPGKPGLLRYAIDRSGVPAKVPYKDVTLRVQLNAAQSPAVTGDGAMVPSKFDGTWLTFSTTATVVDISATGADPNSAGFGTVVKAQLRDDKKWAWSMSFDDNVSFKKVGLPAMSSVGWFGTLYLMNKDDHTLPPAGSCAPPCTWIVDQGDVPRLNDEGWAIGNHSWSHGTFADVGGTDAGAKADVLKMQTLLRTSLDTPTKRPYKIMAFAAPMFDPGYQPAIDDIRDHEPTVDLMFNESGNNWYIQVEGTFNYKQTLGRDWRISEGGKKTSDDPIPFIDKIHSSVDATHHYWWITFTHGVDDQPPDTGFAYSVKYIHDHFGPPGTDEVWVAPTERVYSYLIVRDLSKVTRQ